MSERRELLLGLTDTAGAPLGTMWRITARGRHFYVDFIGANEANLHLSVHGPNGPFEDHRFHVKIDRRKEKQAGDAGYVMNPQLHKKGIEIPGRRLAENTYHVARVRWTWDLQRSRYRHVALNREPIPKIHDSRQGRIMEMPLKENHAWDVDLIVSYGKPLWMADVFWMPRRQANFLSPKIGPLQNDAGMYLTATSRESSITAEPGPTEQLVPRPKNDADAQRLISAGLGEGRLKDTLWFEEKVTSKDFPKKCHFYSENHDV